MTMMIKEHEAPIMFNFYDTVMIMYMEDKAVVWTMVNYPVKAINIFQIYEEELIYELRQETIRTRIDNNYTNTSMH